MPSPELRFEGLDFAFGDSPLLKGFDLGFEAGKLTAILGPSGCGKSTLLRLAAGLLAPAAGRISGSPASKAFVFQAPTLLEWRTVAENVALPLELGAGAGQVDAALDLVGLKDAAQKLPKELSGGMKMRVSLARALVVSPDLMLLDEPFGALDAISRRRLQEEFLGLHQRAPFTGLLVTHDADEAVLLADRAVVVRGRPLQVVLDLPIHAPRPRRRHDPELGRLAAQIEAAL